MYSFRVLRHILRVWNPSVSFSRLKTFRLRQEFLSGSTFGNGMSRTGNGLIQTISDAGTSCDSQMLSMSSQSPSSPVIQNGDMDELVEVNMIKGSPDTKFISMIQDDGQSTGESYAECVDVVCQSLEAENIVAIPTDTIYGIAGLTQSAAAIQKIYDIKGRDTSKPISISVGEVEDVDRWSHVTVPTSLLKALLPGAVTVVLERRECLNPQLNPGTRLVGIRVPDHPLVRDICRHCGQPVALTSANISNQPSTVDVQEFAALWPLLSVVVDGGTLGKSASSRLGSTVVDLSVKGRYRIIRPGSALQSTVELLQRNGLTDNTASS